MKANYIDILVQCPLFENISKEDISQFLTTTKIIIRNYPKQSFIGITGDDMEGIGIILSGKALLTRENTLGERSIVTILEPASMFGEVLLFSDHPLWPATIQTITPSKVLFLPHGSFTASINNCESCQKQLLINLLKDLSNKALILTRKVHYLSLKGVRAKIFAYFKDLYTQQNNSHLFICHKRQELADLLNVSRTALSRELGRLAKENIIDLKGKHIYLHDPTKLDDI